MIYLSVVSTSLPRGEVGTQFFSYWTLVDDNFTEVMVVLYHSLRLLPKMFSLDNPDNQNRYDSAAWNKVKPNQM